MNVPHLVTALKGPLLELERRVLEAQTTIEHWLRSQWQDRAVPFYCSVDLRNAAHLSFDPAKTIDDAGVIGC